MIARWTWLTVAAMVLAGCGGGGVEPSGVTAWNAVGGVTAPGTTRNGRKRQHVYWTLYAGSSSPQLQIARVPLKSNSAVVDVDSDPSNDLLYTSGVAFDSAGRLWVLSFGQHSGNPVTAVAFEPPVTGSSKPLYEIVLNGAQSSNALAFDPSGNLWVTSPPNDSVMEYKAPFKKSGTRNPALTLSASGFAPWGIAFDKSGNLYASDSNSTGKDSIAVLAPPYKGAPYFLNGLTNPAGLAFDKSGNLYASTYRSSGAAVVMYRRTDLKSAGAIPSIVDATGLPSGSYVAAFSFTAHGDLYAANCGNSSSSGVDVYPTGTQPFGKHLAPKLEYSNAEIAAAGCVWGIAVR